MVLTVRIALKFLPDVHLFVSVGIMLTKLRGRIATNMGVTFFDRFRLILIQTASKRFRPLPPPQLKDTIVILKFCQNPFFTLAFNFKDIPFI